MQRSTIVCWQTKSQFLKPNVFRGCTKRFATTMIIEPKDPALTEKIVQKPRTLKDYVGNIRFDDYRTAVDQFMVLQIRRSQMGFGWSTRPPVLLEDSYKYQRELFDSAPDPDTWVPIRQRKEHGLKVKKFLQENEDDEYRPEDSQSKPIKNEYDRHRQRIEDQAISDEEAKFVNQTKLLKTIEEEWQSFKEVFDDKLKAKALINKNFYDQSIKKKKLLKALDAEEIGPLFHWNDPIFQWGFTLVEMDSSEFKENIRKIVIFWKKSFLRIREYDNQADTMYGTDIHIPHEWLLAFKKVRWPGFDIEKHAHIENLWIIDGSNTHYDFTDELKRREEKLDSIPLIKVLKKMKELDPVNWKSKARHFLTHRYESEKE